MTTHVREFVYDALLGPATHPDRETARVAIRLSMPSLDSPNYAETSRAVVDKVRAAVALLTGAHPWQVRMVSCERVPQ